jgi:uncharacterized OsmC-like protein
MISLPEVTVGVTRSSNAEAGLETLFSVEINLPKSLEKREKVLLFNSARKCEVTKMLAGDFHFTYNLSEV